jgi:hypothetical protein
MLTGNDLTIPQAAKAMELSEHDVRKLIHRGLLRSREVAGQEVVSAEAIRRYWYDAAVAESEAAIARMNEEDERHGREASVRTLQQGLAQMRAPRGCLTPCLLLLVDGILAASRVSLSWPARWR